MDPDTRRGSRSYEMALNVIHWPCTCFCTQPQPSCFRLRATLHAVWRGKSLKPELPRYIRPRFKQASAFQTQLKRPNAYRQRFAANLRKIAPSKSYKQMRTSLSIRRATFLVRCISSISSPYPAFAGHAHLSNSEQKAYGNDAFNPISFTFIR